MQSALDVWGSGFWMNAAVEIYGAGSQVGRCEIMTVGQTCTATGPARDEWYAVFTSFGARGGVRTT